MPTKCIDQIATASEIAAPASSRRRRTPVASATCTDRLNPAKAPWIATTSETATSHGSCGTGIALLPSQFAPAPLHVERNGRDYKVCTRCPPAGFTGTAGFQPAHVFTQSAGVSPISANFGCFTLLLTLRRPPSGRLEGWGTNELVRSNVFRTTGVVPRPSRRAPGRAPQ